jgi:hypothetical protein
MRQMSFSIDGGEGGEEVDIITFNFSAEFRGFVGSEVVLFIILESSEKKSIEFLVGCVFNLEANIKMNCV